MLRMMKADYARVAVDLNGLLKNIQDYNNRHNSCSPEGACFKIKVSLHALRERSRFTMSIHAVDSCLFLSGLCF